MSDEGEKVCPLCAEEMDLTDQQLKPCKCGYEICVWCWHQIVEMAEKDETQGRCPACRVPYDKEKIVGMASKCERLVSEMNVDKKKSQRGKSKTSEGRKQLDNVRVIQRNLVYIVGLPFHLADEDVLQRREYFGQYGKVLKVSISRTSTGAIQHFPNNTCSVYITYSKEEEAIRCIQLVHGFVLDGRTLRACFGTTKYCHAWLRNVPCSNPDCLYLHEIGSQEDSFTKDEVISAYTRNQVHQITGATYSSQRRSGTSLPSPTDDNSDISAASQGKPTSKPIVNSHNLTGVRVPSPDSISGRSAAPPIGASWGSRSSLTNTRVSGPSSQKPHMVDGLTSLSKTPISAIGKKVVNDEKTSISQHTNFPGISEPKIVGSKADATGSLAGIAVSSAPLSHLTSSIQPAHSPSTVPPLNTTDAVHSSSIEPREDVIDEGDGSIKNICSSILSMNIHVNQKPRNGYFEHIGQSAFGGTSENVVNTSAVRGSVVKSDFRPGQRTEESQIDLLHGGNHSLSLTNERVDNPATTVDRVHDLYHTSSFSRHSTIPFPQVNSFDSSIVTKFDRNVVDRNKDLTISASYLPSKNPEEIFISEDSNDATFSKFSLGKGDRSSLRRYEGEAKSGAPDMGESSIISSILASDFDPLNDPFVLPQNLGDLFGGEKKLYNVIGSRKLNNASQSRFAFARDEGLSSQVSDFGRSGDYAVKQDPFLSNHSNRNIFHVDKFVNQSNLTVAGGVESDILTNNHSNFTSSKIPISKSQISAPPGFSVPSRLPPPGFPSLATEHKFESTSGSNLPFPRFSQSNYSQVSTSGNTYINGDVEFIDPAILAVGKGKLASSNNSPGIDLRTSFAPQFGYENPRVQPVTHTSLPPYENHRNPYLQESISSFDDGYGNSSRVMEQKQSSNPYPFSYFSFPQSGNGLPSNGPWDSRNEPWRDSNLAMPELLRPERLVFNDSYSGHEDSLKRIPSSDNQYNGIYQN